MLRFLDDRTFYKLGSATPRTADVRIIAATNKDLEKAIRDGAFREDMYYRLNNARIIVVALREREEDIGLLSEHFVSDASRRFQKVTTKISSSVVALFKQYPWPGNVRELKSAIESAVLIAEGDYLTIADLPMNLQQYATGHRDEIATRAMSQIREAEWGIIREALRKASGDKSRAAEFLGISTRTLYRKMAKMKFSEQETENSLPPAVFLHMPVARIK